MPKKTKLTRKNVSNIDGEQLVSDYVTALINRSTTHAAQNEAEISQHQAEYYLQSAPIHTNDVFVTPQDIPIHLQDSLARASLDAQIKKVQAAQIAIKSSEQIEELERNNKSRYIHKKVQLSVIDTAMKPVQSYWQNRKTGKITTGTISSTSINGTIEDIVLQKNLLVLKPSLISRTFNPERIYITAYIVNPETLKPMVSIRFK